MVSDSLDVLPSVVLAAKSGQPPNMVASVSPGPRLKAVIVWSHRGCTSPGRGIWEGGVWIHDTLMCIVDTHDDV